jgi:predicted transcriptional regulator
MAVSLRVPDDVKKRVARLADAQDTTAHAFMLEAIRDKLEAEEARAAFHAEARRRLARMKKSGRGIPAAEVFAYLDARGNGKKPARPKVRRTP